MVGNSSFFFSFFLFSFEIDLASILLGTRQGSFLCHAKHNLLSFIEWPRGCLLMWVTDIMKLAVIVKTGMNASTIIHTGRTNPSMVLA
jgi:hypothetical protein